MSEEPRPGCVWLRGIGVPCDGGGLLVDCDGVYWCTCGKRQEARPQKVITGMVGIEPKGVAS